MVRLDIISDPICPWCYIGKANLDEAIAQTGHNPFDIEWRVFQLNPDMPPEGRDRREYLENLPEQVTVDDHGFRIGGRHPIGRGANSATCGSILQMPRSGLGSRWTCPPAR